VTPYPDASFHCPSVGTMYAEQVFEAPTSASINNGILPTIEQSDLSVTRLQSARKLYQPAAPQYRTSSSVIPHVSSKIGAAPLASASSGSLETSLQGKQSLGKPTYIAVCKNTCKKVRNDESCSTGSNF
jgi:hypothetical protein